MSTDSISIKLVRKGADIAPDYSLTIKSSGVVIYEGFENVGIKGRVQDNISEEKVMNILTDFRNYDFFNFDDEYSVENPEGKPYNVISISITKEDGDTKTKSVTFFQNDKNAPDNLKKLSDSIDEHVNSKKWTEESSPSEIIDEKSPVVKKEKKSDKKFPVKIIGIVAVVAVLLVIIVLVLSQSPINIIDQGENDDIVDPSIDLCITSNYNISSFINLDLATFSLNSFEKGQTVYLLNVYGNITHEGDSNFSSNVVIKFNNNDVTPSNLNRYAPDNNEYELFSFTTDNSWQVGEYMILIELTDHVLSKSVSKEVSFKITEIYPKILVFTPASNVRAYQDYDQTNSFNQNDTVFIYVEYDDIVTTNDNTVCDIALSLNVTSNGVMYYNVSNDKMDVGNKTHAWWFKAGVSYPKGLLYKVSLELIDRNSGFSVTDQTYFSLNS